VASLLPRPGEHAVYNIQVHAEHAYRVGCLGTLVHNDCLTYAKSVLARRPGGAIIKMKPLPPARQTGPLPGYPVPGRHGMGPGASGAEHYFHIEKGIIRDPAHPRGIPVEQWLEDFGRLNKIPPNEILDFFNFLPHL
jgi:hypothetical protein